MILQRTVRFLFLTFVLFAAYVLVHVLAVLPLLVMGL